MSDSKIGDHPDNWSDEDFINPPNLDVVEDDPWSIPTDRSDSTIEPNPPPAGQSRSSDTDTSNQKSDATAPIGQFNDSQLTDDQPDTEVLAPSDEDDWEYDDSYVSDQQRANYHVANLDEPEPLAEYSSDLSETLYELDSDISNLALRIRIDQFVAGIDYATDSHRNGIFQALNEMNSKRLSHLMRWLEQKKWTGQSLLLFIKFRAVWEDNPDWWEYIVWNSGFDTLWRYSTPGALTRDACYELIHSRLHCEPQEVIDESWYEDWDNFVLWKHGFPSFVSFALYRAGLNDREDWWSLLDFTNSVEETGSDSFSDIYKAYKGGYITSIIDSLTGRYRVVEDYSPYRRSYGPPQWFAIQDWYDPVEWHDNLGWSHGWIEATHPYMFYESLDSMFIYMNLLKEE